MPGHSDSVPYAIKIGFTAFMLVMVPCYWYTYGLTNFLFYCDLALFFTLAAVWTGNPLWASMPAVGILLPQVVWIVEFLVSLAGHPLLGVTGYMFDERKSLFMRSLSLFHIWLPALLVYLLYRLGYDRRAYTAWIVLAIPVQTVSYLLLPPPPSSAENPMAPANVNLAHGLSSEAPQPWLPPDLWFLATLVILVGVICWPTHLLLGRLFGPDGKYGSRAT